MTFSPTSVQSQGRTVGTITLTAAAPSGGAVVTLSSSNTDVARVPSNVTVAAGSTSTTVNIDASSVTSNTDVTITGTYAGVSRSGTFTVTPPPLEARFTVNSSSKGTNACAVVDADGKLDCEFDASGSFGSIEQFLWKLIIGDSNYEENRTSARASLTPPCSLLSKGDKDSDGAVSMTVELRLRGRNGTTTSAVSRSVKLYREDYCS
jgi:hypothetical protein